MPRLTDITVLTARRIRDVDAWWHARRGARALPDRRDLDPADLAPHLPYILLSDCTQDPFRVRYRLVGTIVVAVSGFDITGRYLDELVPPDSEEPWQDHYRQAHEKRHPVYGRTTVPTMFGTLFDYEFAIYPLTLGGGDVAQFLAIEDYGPDEPRLRQMIDDLSPWKA